MRWVLTYFMSLVGLRNTYFIFMNVWQCPETRAICHSNRGLGVAFCQQEEGRTRSVPTGSHMGAGGRLREVSPPQKTQ